MALHILELNPRVAVVVSGTTGIGRSISEGPADAGANVISNGRCQAQVDAIGSLIEQKRRKTVRQTCDVEIAYLSNRCEIAHWRSSAKSTDILVNGAGVTKRHSTLHFPEQDWAAILEVNLAGRPVLTKSSVKPC